MGASRCRFWSCDAPVYRGLFACFDHYVDFAAGDLDECPGCGSLKYSGYTRCRPCSQAAPPPGRAARRARAGVARLARAFGVPLRERRPAAHGTWPGPPTELLKEQSASYRVERSDAWTAGDRGVEQFYTYILKLDDATFYAGHTRDLRVRLTEHRDNATSSTAGGAPRLMWFAVSPTRELAAQLEARLKEMIDRNPRRIRTLILGFQDVIRELEDL